MSKHKNQHIVPRCYLKNFITKKIPQNKKHTPGVYVNDKFLSNGWKEKGVNNKIFTKSYVYNLETTDKSKILAVEQFLSQIEHLYTNTIDKIKRGDGEDYHINIFKLFTYFQYIRDPSFIDMLQEGFDKAAGWADEFNGNNELKNNIIDLAKKLIISKPSENNPIFKNPCMLLLNHSKQIFITSDRPVLHKLINYRDACLLFGKEFLTDDINNSIEKPLFYLPITPRLAFISLEFLNSDAHLDEHNSLECVDRLNLLMCIHANQYLYSSSKKPFTNEKNFAKEINRTYRPDYQAKIHTQLERYIFNITDVTKDDVSIKFKTDDRRFLNEVSIGDHIKLIEIYKKGSNVSGMRMAEITQLNHVTGFVEIEFSIKLTI